MLILGLGVLAFLLPACGGGEGGDGQAAANEQYADFVAFYERFHRDSAYQMAHVQFPVEGLPSGADSLTVMRDDFVWTPENWRIHRRIDFDNSDFTQQLIPVTDDLIVERITHKTGQFSMERRFTRWEGEWHLTYFVGLNNQEILSFWNFVKE